MQPSVGIVVLNWNKPVDLKRLLDSLSTLDYVNHDVFVVDNASTDDSVEMINAHPLHTNLLVNKENRGGTGGFNSGIHYAMQSKNYDYLWLLDNDVTVTSPALVELIRVMQIDPSIGIAGSRILNSGNPEFIVEDGAFIDWKSGTVRPMHRNTRKSDAEAAPVFAVDYVAVCSALVRTSALARVGLMDERYFLFWDDMDWGIAFQDAGYKVVAVPTSEVYHAAFTEYRSAVVDAYYGVRNQLLTFSKYRHHGYASLGMFHMLRRVAKGSLIALLSGKYIGELGFLGYWDFLFGRWGKVSRSLPGPAAIDRRVNAEQFEVPPSSRILLIPMKDVNHTESEISYLLEKDVRYVDLLVANDRKKLFNDTPCRRLITVDYATRYGMLTSAITLLKIFVSNYDVAVKSSDDKISPFTYVVRKAVAFDLRDGRLHETDENLKNVWRIILSVVLGEMLGMIMFFFAWMKGFQFSIRPSTR